MVMTEGCVALLSENMKINYQVRFLLLTLDISLFTVMEGENSLSILRNICLIFPSNLPSH